MAKNVGRDENKKKKEGETFYEVIPAVVTPQELELPRINVRTADFLESVVIFSAGTVDVLLFSRAFLMIFGVHGGNLLTYLLYAASYPFVLIINSSQRQIPDLNNNVLSENIAIFLIYFIVFFMAV